jgi:hypothetical protein
VRQGPGRPALPGLIGSYSPSATPPATTLTGYHPRPHPCPHVLAPHPPPPTPQAHNEVSTFSKVSPAESDRFIASYQARITKHDARRKVLRRLEMKGELLTPTVQEE